MAYKTDPYTVSCTTDNEDSDNFFINKIDQEGLIYNGISEGNESKAFFEYSEAKVGQHPHINA